MTVQNYCLGVAFNPERTKVLMVLKIAPAWQNGLLNFPGGKVEAGERFSHAMAREFQEETFVDTASENWKEVAFLCRKNVFNMQVFKITLTQEQWDSAKTCTKEMVVALQTELLPTFAKENKAVSNTGWLLEMALDSDKFQTTVEYKNES